MSRSICVECGAELPPRPEGRPGRRAVLCSAPCKVLRMRRQRAAHYLRSLPGMSPERVAVVMAEVQQAADVALEVTSMRRSSARSAPLPRTHCKQE